MIKVDIGKECTDEYCKKAVESISGILNRDYDAWGLPTILQISEGTTPISYFKEVLDCKTRNMIRKPSKYNIFFRQVKKNLVLKQVHEINTSSLFRQGRIMSEGYRKFPKYTKYERNCDKHYWQFYGAFSEEGKFDRLIAYISVLTYKELILVSQILGHADYLKTGVMNFLLYWTIVDIMNWNSYVKYIQYGFWGSGEDGLRHFKKSMGFKPMDIREGEHRVRRYDRFNR